MTKLQIDKIYKFQYVLRIHKFHSGYLANFVFNDSEQKVQDRDIIFGFRVEEEFKNLIYHSKYNAHKNQGIVIGRIQSINSHDNQNLWSIIFYDDENLKIT
jgi:hypothetical protein